MKTANVIEATKSTQGSGDSTKKKRGRVENLRPWKPGQSGNPGGRKKDDIAAEVAQAIFSENKELIYKAFGKALSKGNAYAFQVLSDRAFGKLKESKEVTHRYEDVPDGDLQSRIDAVIKELGLAKQVDLASETAQQAISDADVTK